MSIYQEVLMLAYMPEGEYPLLFYWIFAIINGWSPHKIRKTQKSHGICTQKYYILGGSPTEGRKFQKYFSTFGLILVGGPLDGQMSKSTYL